MTKLKQRTCVLCKDKFEGYGNNAEPLKKGICCDGCNVSVVAARFLEVKAEKSIHPEVDYRDEEDFANAMHQKKADESKY